MAISVLGVRGAGTGSDTQAAPSFTSTSGSTIIVLAGTFETSGAFANGDCTDNKSNTYTLAAGNGGSGIRTGVAIWYNIGGTRGASHTITVNGPGTIGAINVAVIEISAAGSISFDSTTDATANDVTSPFSVTAAAAISGTQIAVAVTSLSTGGTNAFTNPTGYTTIHEITDGSTSLVYSAVYKVNETGTPTVTWTNSDTIDGDGARQAFATFLESGAAAASLPADSRLRRNVLLRR